MTDSARGVAHPELWPAAKSRGLVDAKTEAYVTGLMARMSLEDKVGQMIQADISTVTPVDLANYPLGSILAGGDSAPAGGDDRAGPDKWVETARAFRAASLAERPGHVAIPIMFGIDAVHGNNNVVGATLFPHNSALGAAHDPALIRRIGVATAQETAAAGIDWAFGPTLAVPQDHRWGRTYEGYSEDPDIVRQYAGEMVLGLQGQAGAGQTLQHGHVAASAKHFLGDGGTINGVDQGDADVSEQDLIRIHAAGYPAAVDAGIMTVMASFSSWQGAKMHGNKSLLTDVLKGRMGFDGFVVGDWNGHGQVPGCTADSCPAAVLAGLDMFMAPNDWKALFTNTVAQVKAGAIPMARIDDAVRRILRVKAKLGLFDPARPFELKDGVIGNAEHRALAREAVRKSLVLLKNNGQVLPLKAKSHVLVVGEAADEIGRQTGGWTLSWQGTGNKNGDFPGAQSIYDGIRQAVTAGGGTADLSADGNYTTKPDVAVVVFGELPYAEFQGDIPSLEFQAGDKQDLALLKRLKAQGIPVVSIFLSGRPLWVNPEINASDAFVAAWFPGSEGGGVADVLVGDMLGRPRYDFTGKLSYSWPKTAAQSTLNRLRQPYDPLFPFGYGLRYADAKPPTVPQLSEVSGVDAAAANIDTYFVKGRNPAPWSFVLRQGAASVPVPGDGTATEVAGALALRPVDAGGIQGAGRQLSWTGKGEAAIAVTGGNALDLTRQANGALSLQVDYRVDEAPAGTVWLASGTGPGTPGALDLTAVLKAAPLGQWQTLKVKLSCFKQAGADLSRVTTPFALSTGGTLRLSLATVRLSADPAGSVCPGALKAH
ncbi:exo 1,3/1,4-beta-D-glucan glucohydrolase [Nitrospirillum sp. BR 11163]|uniref:glycoside hydrolase family 3 protein n=1 Tax=Nitrospirillum sp. BR 11163 TaxID=3104323 RepID=UPI002B000CAF|nr:exo 1,3/1,4-beta-D-glucan glucohydrolase [Nitrospirillum sp. BR 11163]MEA1675043.1 exo 1,3/1,4-beta-D-glucan glucohydrolase [Nitrospirillum sp. BR 11163]